MIEVALIGISSISSSASLSSSSEVEAGCDSGAMAAIGEAAGFAGGGGVTTTPPLRTSRYSEASTDLVGVIREVGVVWVEGVVMVVGVTERLLLEVSVSREASPPMGSRPGGGGVRVTSLQVVL